MQILTTISAVLTTSVAPAMPLLAMAAIALVVTGLLLIRIGRGLR